MKITGIFCPYQHEVLTMDQVFSTARRGYSPEEVDSYINQLQALINQRNQELSQYKAKEAAISQSIEDAKVLSSQIIANAQNQAGMILQDAEKKAAAIKENSDRDTADLCKRVKALRKKLEGFKSAYNQILQQYLIAARASEMTALFDDLDATMQKLDLSKDDDAPVSINDLAHYGNSLRR